MKIAYFTDNFFPLFGGVSISIRNFATELAIHGHQIRIYAPATNDKVNIPQFHKNITVEWFPSVPVLHFPFRFSAPSPNAFLTLKKWSPDIVHVHSSFIIGTQGAILANLLKKPFVYTFHSYYMDPEVLKMFKINKPIPIIQNGLWKYERYFTKNAQVIICPTQFVAEDLKRRKFNNPKVVLPSGFNLKKIPVNKKKYFREKMRKILKLTKNNKVVLGVGRLSAEKNWSFLLASFSLLYKKNKNLKLILIGKGPLENELTGLTKLLKIENGVIFLGEIPYNKLIEDGYYFLGDVFVMPSDYETQGMVTVEAMAAGLPIIAVNSKGTKNLVKDVGIVVIKEERRFSEAIEIVLNNQSLMEEMSKKSLHRAQEYSIQQLTLKLINLYKSLL